MRRELVDEVVEAKNAGCLFYELPHELQPEQVDPLIWPIVEKINLSGWVWTAESCQGHPDVTELHSWDHNLRPMLRLVCRTHRAGDMLFALVNAMRVPKDSDERGPGVMGLEVWASPVEKRGWTEVLVYVGRHAQSAYERNRCLDALSRFARETYERRPRETDWAMDEQT